jgi:cytochrome P450 family 135
MSIPPGPRGPALLTLSRYVLRPEAFFRRGRERYGLNFSADLAGLGRFVFLGEPTALKDVFLGDPAILRTGEANAFVAHAVGERSLLTLDGEAHAHARRILIPPLHGEHLEPHGELVAALTHAEVDRWQVGVPLRLEDACREVALQVILRVVFGLARGPETQALASTVREVMRLLSNPLAFMAHLVPRALLKPTPWGRLRPLLAEVDAGIFRLIAARRAELEGAPPEQGRGEVLATLIRARDPRGEPLADQEIRDHLFTLLLAGHDTSAIALGWAFSDLLPRPELCERVRSELSAVGGGGPLGPAEVRQLRFLDALIKESLRLRPLVDFSVRRLAAPFEAGGVRYPAGVTLAPCTYLAHFNPEVFPEPEEFRPERFLDERPDPYTWIPFGGGQRRCLGMNFALFELRVVLATVLQRVRFAPRGPTRVEFQRRGLFLAPSDRATFVPTEITPAPRREVPA